MGQAGKEEHTGSWRGATRGELLGAVVVMAFEEYREVFTLKRNFS